jgi:2-dehydro-3-deoxyphosphooctonate aldolase (KDO 8-P synthase)
MNDSLLWNSIQKASHLTLIAGPCVIENERLCLQVASSLQKTCRALRINYVFKASFDKANRSSGKSFRGPGLKEGLEILARVRRELGLPVLTDVHTQEQVQSAAAVVDILQIPAFLCRQNGFDHRRRPHGQNRQSEKGPIPVAGGNGAGGQKGRRRGGA